MGGHSVKTLFRILCFCAMTALLVINVYVELKPGMVVGIGAKLAYACAFTALWSMVCFSKPGGGSPARRHGYYLALFGYYIWMLLNLLFFDAAFGRADGVSGLNRVPFLTIRNYLRAYALGNISLKWVLINLAGNLAAFAPMGFFLPALYPKQRNFFIYVPTVTVMVALVEVLQYLTRTGSCDVDDLILNVAGAFAVWLVCLLPPFRGWVRQITPEKGRR